MRIYNYIILVVLTVLGYYSVYLNIEFAGIVVDEMSDGQAGIGKAMVALFILAIGVLSFLIALTQVILLLIRKKNQTTLSKITLAFSILITLTTFLLFYY